MFTRQKARQQADSEELASQHSLAGDFPLSPSRQLSRNSSPTAAMAAAFPVTPETRREPDLGETLRALRLGQDSIQQRLNAIEQRLDGIDQRLQVVEQRQDRSRPPSPIALPASPVLPVQPAPVLTPSWEAPPPRQAPPSTQQVPYVPRKEPTINVYQPRVARGFSR